MTEREFNEYKRSPYSTCAKWAKEFTLNKQNEAIKRIFNETPDYSNCILFKKKGHSQSKEHFIRIKDVCEYAIDNTDLPERVIRLFEFITKKEDEIGIVSVSDIEQKYDDKESYSDLINEAEDFGIRQSKISSLKECVIFDYSLFLKRLVDLNDKWSIESEFDEIIRLAKNKKVKKKR